MSDQFCFQLTEAEVLKAVEEYVNRVHFKTPKHLTDMTGTDNQSGFDFVAEALATEMRIPKPKKESKKRGLKEPVLEQQAGNGSMEQEE